VIKQSADKNNLEQRIQAMDTTVEESTG